MATPKQGGRVNAEIIAAVDGKIWRKAVMVPKGQTVGWAVNASGLYQQFPALRSCKLGVWGKVAAPETLVEDGDRVEIYTPVEKAAVAAVRG